MYHGTVSGITLFVALSAGARALPAADNELSPEEKKAGWILLFDGKSLDGWMNSNETAPKRPVEEASLDPHRAGHYMVVRKEKFSDFVLALDFKIAKGTNSGVFIRTSSLVALPGKDVGYNGIEIAIDDTPGADFHDTGALYDLVKPSRNAMKQENGKREGLWNHMVVTCDGPKLSVELNGEVVTRMNLDEWKLENKRPDGSDHKFDTAWKDHPRSGYIGLQDHGGEVWFKNLKLLPRKSGDDKALDKKTATKG